MGRVRGRVRRGYEWASGNPATVGLVALTIGCLATLLVVGTYLRGESTRNIVTKSECAKNSTNPTPGCEDLRQAIARNEAIEGPCILVQRATGRKGKNCPEVYVPLDGSSEAKTPAGTAQDADEGRAPVSASPGGSAPKAPPPRNGQQQTPGGQGNGSPGSKGQPRNPSGGGKDPAPEPQPTAPPAQTPPATTPAPEPEPETKPDPPAKGKPPTVQEGVGQVVDGVGKTGCAALPAACPLLP